MSRLSDAECRMLIHGFLAARQPGERGAGHLRELRLAAAALPDDGVCEMWRAFADFVVRHCAGTTLDETARDALAAHVAKVVPFRFDEETKEASA